MLHTASPSILVRRVIMATLAAALVLISGCTTPAAAPSADEPETPAAAETGGGGAADARPVLITFTKPGCPACLKLAPVLATVAGDYEDKVRFEEINTDIAKQLVFDHMITATPTVIIFVEGKEASRMINPKEDALRSAIEEVLSSKG